MADNKDNKIPSWADVQLSPDMPISAAINFLNVLNQRLVQVENVLQVPFENEMITLTELYRKMSEQQKQQEEQKEGK